MTVACSILVWGFYPHREITDPVTDSVNQFIGNSRMSVKSMARATKSYERTGATSKYALRSSNISSVRKGLRNT